MRMILPVMGSIQIVMVLSRAEDALGMVAYGLVAQTIFQVEYCGFGA